MTVDDLRRSEWVAPGPGAQRRAVFESIFRQGTLPRFSVETHSLLTIFVLLAQSSRMAVLTVSEVELNKRLGNQLVTLNYDITHGPARMGVTVRRNWTRTPLQQNFLDFLHT